MKIDKGSLDAAARQGLIVPAQAEALWRFLEERQVDVATFRFTHVLYYFGGMIAIGAMTLFMTLGWEAFGGLGLLTISLAYGAGALWLVEYLLYRRRLPIPAGIVAVLVVALVPLAIYGLQSLLGLWDEGAPYRDYYRWDDWRWMLLHLGALLTALVLLRRYRLPFLVMPVAVTLWFMCMSVASVVIDGYVSWWLRRWISIGYGSALIALALWVDIRREDRQDFAFWLYLFGALAFWSGLSLMNLDSAWTRFGYFCINLVMIFVGAIIGRRVFTVLGAIGAAGYLSYLAYSVFRDSLIFPFALTVIGLGLIWVGILWQRHETHIVYRLRQCLPTWLRHLAQEEV